MMTHVNQIIQVMLVIYEFFFFYLYHNYYFMIFNEYYKETYSINYIFIIHAIFNISQKWCPKNVLIFLLVFIILFLVFFICFYYL